MDIHLGEGYGDAVGVEGFVDVFADAEPDSPVVLDGDPHPEGEDDRAVGEFADGDDGFLGLVEDKGVVVDDLQEYFLGAVEVGAIGDGGDNVEAEDGLFGVVDDGLVGEFAIRDNDGAAVEGLDGGVEDADGADIAFVIATLDIVVDLKGFHEQDDDTTGEILESSLESHADGETHGTEEGDEGGGLDAYDIHSHDDDHGFEEHVDERAEEGLEGGFGVAFLEGADDELLEHLGKLHADPKDEYGDEELGDEANGELGEGVEAVLDNGVATCDHVFEVGEVHAFEAVGHGAGDAVLSEDSLAEFVFKDRRGCVLRSGSS